MDEPYLFDEVPAANNVQMLAGWREWADAGSVSSALPEYLIKLTGARKIGELRDNNFYLFQIPGAHHLLRPVIHLKDGYRHSLEEKRNEFYYAGDSEKGLVIFLGDEPHLGVAAYASAFFAAVKRLGVTRIGGLAGVYAPVPYDRDRQVSCIYSMPAMKQELEDYAVSFSDYEGGSSIGSYLVSRAEAESIPYFIFYAIAPAYDFAGSELMTPGIRLENDYKAWYDVMRRVNHLMKLNLDLRDLEERSAELISVVSERIAELEDEMPELGIREYLADIEDQFTESPFVMLDDVWEDELRNLFGKEDDPDS